MLTLIMSVFSDQFTVLLYNDLLAEVISLKKATKEKRKFDILCRACDSLLLDQQERIITLLSKGRKTISL